METGRPYNAPQLFAGLVVVALGLFALLDAFHVLEFRDPWRFWPLLLIALGLSKMLGPRGSPGRWWGFVFVLAGTWLLARNLGMWPFRLRDFVLPALALLVGGRLIWGAFFRSGRGELPTDASARLSTFALLGGAEHRSGASDFRGGDVTAILGACKVDFLDAKAASGEVVLDVFALWGGIEIVVPREWTVVVQVTPILGAVEDKIRSVSEPSGPRLVVRGTVIMGGVEIKN